MIELELKIELDYRIDHGGADFMFNIHAAHTPCQKVVAEHLSLNQDVAHSIHTDLQTGNRYMRLHAQPGPLNVVYTATVAIDHYLADPAGLAEVPLSKLPPQVVGYIFPSRYCQSDRMLLLAANTFGTTAPGYERVRAIRDWVREHVTYASNTTNSSTSAVDTLVEQTGVCRDFAHLMVALCRALNIPARIASGTDFGSPGEPDFHAYVEVFVGGRWYIFDPSDLSIPMGLVRIGTGRDAADVAFATILGGVESDAPRIRATAKEDPARGIMLPHAVSEALSTDDGRSAQDRAA